MRRGKQRAGRRLGAHDCRFEKVRGSGGGNPKNCAGELWPDGGGTKSVSGLGNVGGDDSFCPARFWFSGISGFPDLGNPSLVVCRAWHESCW